MKINVCFVYWIFFLVALVSSSLLFILAACEVQSSDIKITINASVDDSSSSSSISTTNEDVSVTKSLKPVDIKLPSKQPSTGTKQLESTQYSQDDRTVAAVHSSFADPEVKPSWSNDAPSQSSIDVSVSPKLVAEFSDGLTSTGQAVVLTLLESATSELQKQASFQTEGLRSSLHDSVASNSSPDNHTQKTPPTPPKPMHTVQEAPDRENRSTDELEDAHHVAQAEPKVLEVRYNIVDVESVVALPGFTKEATVASEEPPAAGEIKPVREEEKDLKVAPTADEIPSFSEWAQKQLEEAEKKELNGTLAGTTSSSRLSSSSKLRSKNYASPDCGAKIVAANPEAESANSVLSPSRDEYVLNACVHRIWLVVELCEAIQAKRIDIANFELFSSSPKDFSVSVSDRFPSRDWRSVGHFTAKDVRDVQSYDLHPHLFGKFIKVELHSHYGSEHYCPVSLIRVYGTSEFEVLEETEVEAHQTTHDIDEDEEGTLETGDPSEPPRNLFGSAREVVMSIVKKATEALGKGGETGNETSNATDLMESDLWSSSELSKLASTPSHLIVCDNCSNSLYSSVWILLGQKGMELYDFVQMPFVREALLSGPICAGYGLDFGRRRPLNYPNRPDPGDYLKSLLPERYIVALCNALAVIEKKVVLNASQDSKNTTNLTSYNDLPLNTDYEGVLLPPVATCSMDTSLSSDPCKSPVISKDLATSSPHSDSSSSELIASQIKPTKTLTDAEVNDRLFVSTNLPDVSVPQESIDIPKEVPLPVESTVSTVENATGDPLILPSSKDGNVEANQVTDQIEEPIDSAEAFQAEEDSTLDTLLSDLKDLDPTLDVTSPPVLSSTTTTLPPQKESVFVRISNRIKALERNMSLSSQYLEELSRRYKRQVEEISRSLNRTLAAAEIEAKRRDDLEKKHSDELLALREEIASLTAAVNSLLTERDSWHNKAMFFSQHVVFIVIEVLFFVGVFCLCRRLPVWDDRTHDASERKWSLGWKKTPTSSVKRRKSMESVPEQFPPQVRKKRPSEVALNIAGTYRDLLITDIQTIGCDEGGSAPRAETKRRRRRKKDGSLPKSSSSNSLQQKHSRKASTNSCNGRGSSPCRSDIRRSSLCEIDNAFWCPVNGSEKIWSREQEEPLEVQEVQGIQPTRSSSDVLTQQCLIDVIENNWTSDTLGDSLPVLQESNGSLSVTTCENVPKYRSLSSVVSAPAFMRTATSSRADRRASEANAKAKLKFDNWEFWHSSQQSSQTSLVPMPMNGNGKDGHEDSSDKGSEAGGSQERKKTKGFKKMVKRFF